MCTPKMPLLHSSSVLLLFFYAQVSFVRGEVFQTDLHMLNPSCLNRLRRFCPWLLLCSALVVWQDVAIVQAQVVNLHFSAIYSHTADLFGKFVKGQVFGAGFKLQSTDIGQHLYMPWHELLHVVTDCICSGGFFFFFKQTAKNQNLCIFPSLSLANYISFLGGSEDFAIARCFPWCRDHCWLRNQIWCSVLLQSRVAWQTDMRWWSVFRSARGYQRWEHDALLFLVFIYLFLSFFWGGGCFLRILTA